MHSNINRDISKKVTTSIREQYFSYKVKRNMLSCKNLLPFRREFRSTTLRRRTYFLIKGYKFIYYKLNHFSVVLSKFTSVRHAKISLRTSLFIHQHSTHLQDKEYYKNRNQNVRICGFYREKWEKPLEICRCCKNVCFYSFPVPL